MASILQPVHMHDIVNTVYVQIFEECKFCYFMGILSSTKFKFSKCYKTLEVQGVITRDPRNIMENLDLGNLQNYIP